MKKRNVQNLRPRKYFLQFNETYEKGFCQAGTAENSEIERCGDTLSVGEFCFSKQFRQRSVDKESTQYTGWTCTK